MKVSIIMCAYNVAEFIERAIDSIVAQTYSNWELIISNDGSTDETLAIIERYLNDPRVHLVNQPVNQGYVANKNIAFTYATGELLTQLDADDTCHPERIEKQVQLLTRKPELMICGTNYQQIDLRDQAVEGSHYPSDFLINEPRTTYPFWFPGLMFRRSLLEEFGPYSDYFAGIYGDDYHWTIRVNRRYPIYFINEILYNYRINPGSLTNIFDNPRKLIVSEIISELLKQQKESGKDWIEEGEHAKMRQFEAELLSNSALMAEKYRLWAAKAIDKRDLKLAKSLLEKSIKLQTSNKDIYKTILYYVRRRIFN